MVTAKMIDLTQFALKINYEVRAQFYKHTVAREIDARQALVKAANIQPDEYVADVACVNGATAFQAMEKLETPANALCLDDGCEAMLAAAFKRVSPSLTAERRAGFRLSKRVDLTDEGELRRLARRLPVLDCILCYGFINHLCFTDRKTFLSISRIAICVGGRLAFEVSFFNPLNADVSTSGWVREVETGSYDHYANADFTPAVGSMIALSGAPESDEFDAEISELLQALPARVLVNKSLFSMACANSQRWDEWYRISYEDLQRQRQAFVRNGNDRGDYDEAADRNFLVKRIEKHREDFVKNRLKPFLAKSNSDTTSSSRFVYGDLKRVVVLRKTNESAIETGDSFSTHDDELFLECLSEDEHDDRATSSAEEQVRSSSTSNDRPTTGSAGRLVRDTGVTGQAQLDTLVSSAIANSVVGMKSSTVGKVPSIRRTSRGFRKKEE